MTRLRRNPRGERAAKAVAGGARIRFDLAARAEDRGRPRRDPRAESAELLIGGHARPRLDRSGAAGAAPSSVEETAPTAPKIAVVESPAFLIAVVPDALGERLSQHDRQLFGAARMLAGADGAVVALVAGEVEGLASAGADRIVAIGEPGYDPEGRAAAIAGALSSLGLRYVLFPETSDGGDVARRLAVLSGEPLFSDVEQFSATSVSRAARGRRVEQRAASKRLMTVAADAVAAYAGPEREARPEPVAPAAPIKRAILDARRITADPATTPLTVADFVVSAGNGVTDLALFRRLAEALGATPGASRMLCDAGLMPRESQVGASGSVLTATCYFALGIAGAPQHLQGVAGCEHVVAVNTDLHAAMIERAGLAIVADAQDVMQALIAALKEEGA
ncbi:electron transfer flavoprotein subunit alpha/FixB family protein [Hansschlegelia quercus]|uniref:Electron transfer flavoprotein subunit alpha/FixB family protein n=1 Tax=Hansschlegelia quercus TaxID=2528245 RepID=A0A4Q9G982_9HYPH|nr:electron transfer flavoprotein subunit alpha/FixB family protein [Hansschlegelia quercus]TBN47337.1 electron transfer flavoprotein subunit alpha/FixB family protein [Hansschlegelia quercus]